MKRLLQYTILLLSVIQPSYQLSRSGISPYITNNSRLFLDVRGGQEEEERLSDATDSHPSSHTNNRNHQRNVFRLVQVQIVHRHGDRSPITPLRDEEYWYQTLPPPEILQRLSSGMSIRILHGGEEVPSTSVGSSVSHAAAGTGPFGKLTQLGLFQMVEVGSRLRDELLWEPKPTGDGDGDGDVSEETTDEHGNIYRFHGRLFTPHNPLHPDRIKLHSTKFERALQSLQALLVGLFPDGIPPSTTTSTSLDIDTTNAEHYIPDPQPRATQEQVQLERTLSRRPHLRKRDAEVRDLSLRLTSSLSHLLARGANDVSYGIGEEDKEDKEEKEENDHAEHKTNSHESTTTTTTTTNKNETPPHSSSQLADVLTCLHHRNLLPPSITEEDYQTVASHAAYRWFENMRDPRLAHLAMGRFVGYILHNLQQSREQDERRRRRDAVKYNNDDDDGGNDNKNKGEEEEEKEEPCLQIYSCHDSSLIGLICAFRLNPPAVWPEYGSCLKVELFHAETGNGDGGGEEKEGKGYYTVRFSLNGEILKSSWGVGEEGYETSAEMIPLEHLVGAIEREHGSL